MKQETDFNIDNNEKCFLSSISEINDADHKLCVTGIIYIFKTYTDRKQLFFNITVFTLWKH